MTLWRISPKDSRHEFFIRGCAGVRRDVDGLRRAGAAWTSVVGGEGDTGRILRGVGEEPERRRAAGSWRARCATARERRSASAAASGAAGTLWSPQPLWSSRRVVERRTTSSADRRRAGESCQTAQFCRRNRVPWPGSKIHYSFPYPVFCNQIKYHQFLACVCICSWVSESILKHFSLYEVRGSVFWEVHTSAELLSRLLRILSNIVIPPAKMQ